MKGLYIGAPATGTGTVAYTVPTDFKTDVVDITYANTTAGALSLKVHLVPPGGTADATNMMIPNVSIAANTYGQWKGTQTMTPGGKIVCIASGAGIAVAITGDEYRRGGAV